MYCNVIGIFCMYGCWYVWVVGQDIFSWMNASMDPGVAIVWGIIYVWAWILPGASVGLYLSAHAVDPVITVDHSMFCSSVRMLCIYLSSGDVVMLC